MDEDRFWDLIDQVGEDDRRGGRIAHALVPRLARLPVPQIADFHTLLVAQGSQTFDEALDDPDLLAEHPRIVKLAGLARR